MATPEQNKAKKSSKKSRANEVPPGGVQFLTFSSPQDWNSKESRLAVRSHVTRRQHQLSRGEVASLEELAVPSSGNIKAGATSRLEVLRFPNHGHRKRKSIATLEDDTADKRRSWTADKSVFGGVHTQPERRQSWQVDRGVYTPIGTQTERRQPWQVEQEALSPDHAHITAWHTDRPLFSPVEGHFVLPSQNEHSSCAPSPWITTSAPSSRSSSASQRGTPTVRPSLGAQHPRPSSAHPSRSNSISYSGPIPGSTQVDASNSIVYQGPMPDPQQISLFALPLNSLGDVAAREMLFTAMEDYMLRSFAPAGYSALFLTPEAGRVWSDTLRHQSRIEPSLRLVRLLFASGHLSQLNLLRPEVGVWLHERAVAEMYTALASEKRNLPEGLILATGRLALYESMFGDPRLAHEFHRPAQQRMIASKGGMEALKLPEAVKYLMRWSDIIMSLQSGLPSLLGASTEDNLIQPDSARHSLRALAVWLPQQYVVLLTKIQARDPEGLQLGPVNQIDPLILSQ